jgi:hypothetical protein
MKRIWESCSGLVKSKYSDYVEAVKVSWRGMEFWLYCDGTNKKMVKPWKLVEEGRNFDYVELAASGSDPPIIGFFFFASGYFFLFNS